MRIRTLFYIALFIGFLRKLLSKVLLPAMPAAIDFREGMTHMVDVEVCTVDGKQSRFEGIMSFVPWKLSKTDMTKALNKLNGGGWKNVFYSHDGTVVSARFSIRAIPNVKSFSTGIPAQVVGSGYVKFRMLYGLVAYCRLREMFGVRLG